MANAVCTVRVECAWVEVVGSLFSTMIETLSVCASADQINEIMRLPPRSRPGYQLDRCVGKRGRQANIWGTGHATLTPLSR